MTRPSFGLLVAVTVIAAVLVAWLPIYLGGVHGYHDLSLTMAIAWFALFGLCLVLYGRRALWLLLASPPALFWLFVTGGAIICVRGCG